MFRAKGYSSYRFRSFRLLAGVAALALTGTAAWASEFPSNLDLSALDGTTGFQISGEAAIDFSGASVSAAGDVNGDGFGDVIVGAFRASPHGNYSGASYVVFGKASGIAPVIE